MEEIALLARGHRGGPEFKAASRLRPDRSAPGYNVAYCYQRSSSAYRINGLMRYSTGRARWLDDQKNMNHRAIAAPLISAPATTDPIRLVSLNLPTASFFDRIHPRTKNTSRMTTPCVVQ